MLDLKPRDVQEILLELEQAISFHEQWYAGLVRGLVTRLPPDGRDLREDAHRQCRFGQWYYNFATASLRRHPAFVGLEKEHERMHQQAAQLLRSSMAERTVPLKDYDLFSNTLERLRLELLSLRRELEDSLYNVDSLTGAQSRIGMLTKLREQQEMVKRGVQSCAIAMTDVDHFKAVNDTYGHPTGDKVLAAVARFVLDRVRPYDKFYRYGGEEFFLCMPNTDIHTGHGVVERLRDKLAAGPVARVDDRDVQITASFGLTLLDPDASVEVCVERADKALYAAKTAGRNCTRVWDAAMV
jgi:diguanylate cyclase (GGDEF)-like protein